METGEFYHIYNRGNNKQKIFFEDKNYSFFLQRVDKYLSGFADTYAYCLMPNHFHLLFKILKLEDKGISIHSAFKHLFMSYSKAINEQYNRIGALFQPKYKAKPIKNDFYFSEIIPYIHMNPVKANLCKHPSEWKYSSYSGLISDKPTGLQREAVLEWFGGRERFMKIHEDRAKEFRQLEDYLKL